MNTDQLLNIHQSYSLTTIKAINQQILIAQYAQCEQISKLQKEIAASNEVLRQILRNQLVDLQYREKMRYYKSLAYNSLMDLVVSLEPLEKLLWLRNNAPSRNRSDCRYSFNALIVCGCRCMRSLSSLPLPKI